MTNFIKTQSSFINGEVAPEFFLNDNINGLAKLENADVVAGGGIKRRPGLVRVATLNAKARLIPFSVSENENYVLAIMNQTLQIFHDGDLIQELSVPWSYQDSLQIQYAQRQGLIMFVHPNYHPKMLFKENETFKIKDFNFLSSDGENNIDMPFTRFDDSKNITITLTYTQNGILFTTSSDFWTSENVGGYLSLIGKTWLITSYISPTTVIAICNGQYTLPQTPVSNWQEAVFSNHRGWPASVTFHQDRLVFGGSLSCPGSVWMSHTGEHTNFNLGTGLDDEAIYFSLVSGQRQHICTMISSNSLQILTSEGEWVVSNTPLTPTSVNIKMQTAIGCMSDGALAPQKIDGTTVFVSKNKSDVCELVLDELSQNYVTNNLCSMSSHLINNPTDISYNKKSKKLFVVLANGNMAVMNKDSGLGIAAWGIYKTQGYFDSVISIGGETFAEVTRGNNVYLEKFSDSAFIDSNDYTYSVRITGLPLKTSGHNAKHVRIKKITARVMNTKTLKINNKSVVFPNEIYDNNHIGYSGDVSLNFLGTDTDFVDLPWMLSCDDSLPLKILSVTIYGRYQI